MIARPAAALRRTSLIAATAVNDDPRTRRAPTDTLVVSLRTRIQIQMTSEFAVPNQIQEDKTIVRNQKPPEKFREHYEQNILTKKIQWFILKSNMANGLGIFQRQSTTTRRGDDSQIRVYRAHAARAMSEERWDVAEIFFDRILSVDPRHTEAWLMKGHLRQHCRNDDQSAVYCYRKVIALCGSESANPHAERAQSSLARLLAVWS